MTESTAQETMLPQPDTDTIVDLPVDKLLLDPKNPRLAWRAESDSQEDLLRVLWREMAVDEVALSIAANGFFRSEPLFVIMGDSDERDPAKVRYVVIEGNRRLAAVRLLRDEQLRQELRATDLPEIDEDARSRLDKIPAILYKSREDLWTTIGFRHVNGIKAWDSFSKAEYIAQVHENIGIPLDDIARTIGDTHATVQRMYRGYKILQQAESQVGFDREDTKRNRFYFSHLYTAASYREYQELLGIDRESSLGPNPVPEEKLEQLEELMTWLYGRESEGIEPVVKKQDPDLNTLRVVISKPESLKALRSGYPLDRAHDIALGARRLFRDALNKARLNLRDAMATVTGGYRGEEDLDDIIEEVIDLSRNIAQVMANMRRRSESTPEVRPGMGEGGR